MKKAFFVVGLCLAVSAAIAHEFWLQPSLFFAKAGDEISLKVMVGENFLGERSEGQKNRIIQYRHHTANGTADLVPTLTGGTYGDLSVALNMPGTHLFSFANTPKFLSMKADSFLLYLREDGLNKVITARQQQGTSGKPSREIYQRCVKSLVQVGDTPDHTFAKNTGMPLEIIPAKNPYEQRFGQSAEFRVYFMDKPLEGALVRYWSRDAANHLTEEKQITNALGDVRFRLRIGQNMVSVVHMVPAQNTSQADWHSYWGSLTFGCR